MDGEQQAFWRRRPRIRLFLVVCAVAIPQVGRAQVTSFNDASGKPTAASPTNPFPVANKPIYTPLGCTAWQAVTTGSAVALSAAPIPAGATLVDIVPSTTIVLRDDGSAPTSAGPGIPIQANTIYPYSGTIGAVQFIAQSASGTVSACFYK